MNDDYAKSIRPLQIHDLLIRWLGNVWGRVNSTKTKYAYTEYGGNVEWNIMAVILSHENVPIVAVIKLVFGKAKNPNFKIEIPINNDASTWVIPIQYINLS